MAKNNFITWNSNNNGQTAELNLSYCYNPLNPDIKKDIDNVEWTLAKNNLVLFEKKDVEAYISENLFSIKEQIVINVIS